MSVFDKTAEYTTVKEKVARGFITLESEGADFINYISEKASFPFTFSNQSDFEEMLDTLERFLKIQGKSNPDKQMLLYKVLKVKKLLKKLHEGLTDIEKSLSESELEEISRVVRGDVSLEELEKLEEKEMPRGDFYDYAGIRGVLLRKLNGEINSAFFNSWLSMLCRLLRDEKYDTLTNCFSAYTYGVEPSDKLILEILATLKDFNFKLIHKDYIARHRHEKRKVIYLRFLHYNRSNDSRIFKAYFVDYKAQRFDVRIVDDGVFDYRDDIMYCDIWSNHFDEDGDYMDADGDYEYEPAELPEEEQVMNYLYKDGWVYDHELEL